MDRRGFLKMLGTATVVVGFDPIGRRWITRAEASTCSSFADAPTLDGVLLLDDASRAAVSGDKGNLIFRTPCAVLRPGSVADISRMIRYCREHGIHASTRGQAHTTYGQGLSDGLIIENMALNAIHEIGPEGAIVDTGIRWKDLVLAAYEDKLTPPALTGYVQLTVGGTLSVGGIGGISGSVKRGLQIDHARELEVVTGKGDVKSASPDHNRALFEAMLGGLGQCGVMTKAKLDLVPAKERARTYNFHYTDNTPFFKDLRILIDRPGLDHVFTLWFPPGTTDDVYQLQATVFYDVTSPPNDVVLTSGLTTPPQTIQDATYLDYVQQVDVAVDGLRATAEWDHLIKPWFDVWLPDSKAEGYVGDVIGTLTPEDVGPAGFILLFPQRRSRATRPLLRLPAADGSDWVFLFDILTASARPGPNPEFSQRMIERNNRLFATARDSAGGVRYPIGTLDFTPGDWEHHYGDAWQTFRQWKRRFDPDRILGMGAGIFG